MTQYDTMRNQSADKSEHITQCKTAFSQPYDVHDVCKGYMNADVRTKITALSD